LLVPDSSDATQTSEIKVTGLNLEAHSFFEVLGVAAASLGIDRVADQHSAAHPLSYAGRIERDTGSKARKRPLQ
jgi:hypothetical protein